MQFFAVFLKRYRGNGMNVTEEWYKMVGLMQNVGQNFFIVNYSDGINLHNKKIEGSSNYNYDNKTYNPAASDSKSVRNLQEYYDAGMPYMNEFFTKIDASTSEVITYDNKGRGVSYYSVKVKVNPNKLDERFMKLFSNLGAIGVSIESIYITFKMDKTTGYFVGYDAVGTFSASYLGFSATCTTTFKEIYYTMNQSAEEQIKDIARKNFGL